MTRALLSIRGLRKRFGGLAATDGVDLDVVEGEIHALIGPNGAGKTTLLTQLFGELTHDSGEIRLDGELIDALSTPQRVRRGLARTFQINQLLPDFSMLDNVALAVQARQGHSFRFFANARRDRDLRQRARDHLAAAGLADRAETRVADLSHGEQKQLEFAIALACEPRLLLLDEPMAGLGHAESEQMVAMLAGLKGRITMLLVEHDMDAVFTLADRISVLVYGRIIATGTAQEIRDNADVRTPLMLYLFHRIDKLLTGERTIIAVDEFWKALGDDAFRSFAQDGLKTYRKRNAMMVFATQSPADALKSDIAHSILEQVATQVMLPNPKGSRRDYVEGFSLTDAEYQLIREELSPESRKFLVKQGHDSVVVELDLTGLDNELAVLSGRAETTPIAVQAAAEFGPDPANWLPVFHQRRRPS